MILRCLESTQKFLQISTRKPDVEIIIQREHEALENVTKRSGVHGRLAMMLMTCEMSPTAILCLTFNMNSYLQFFKIHNMSFSLLSLGKFRSIVLSFH